MHIKLQVASYTGLSLARLHIFSNANAMYKSDSSVMIIRANGSGHRDQNVLAASHWLWSIALSPSLLRTPILPNRGPKSRLLCSCKNTSLNDCL